MVTGFSFPRIALPFHDRFRLRLDRAILRHARTSFLTWQRKTTETMRNMLLATSPLIASSVQSTPAAHVAGWVLVGALIAFLVFHPKALEYETMQNAVPRAVHCVGVPLLVL